MTYGPKLAFSEEIHSHKYRLEGESFKESRQRIASALKDNEDHYYDFRDILLHNRFMPAGRVQRAMGSTQNVTPYNCFVSGTIEDSFVDGPGCIMAIATEAAATMRMGGGIGYDFSTLRPSGDLIHKLQSLSSGPISFMEIFNATCKCIASSGHRRGAQMGVLRVDHPDVEQFIHAKQPPTEAGPIMDQLADCVPGSIEWAMWYSALQAVYKLTGFNISLAITDEFMECMIDDKPFTLQFNGQKYREVDSSGLWEKIMRSTWDWAEPGALFIDRINEMNNLYYCETIAATNPCGEQPLPPYGACLLGSFNLVKYIKRRTSPFQGNMYEFDWTLFVEDIPPVVQAMDNVVDRAIYPLPQQQREAHMKRRMGLGVTGVANALECLGLPYGSREYVIFQDKVLNTLTNHAYRASAEIASRKGPFGLYDQDKYLQGKFIQTLDSETQMMIECHGIRNSHLTSIAPTGTISMTADNVSSGIEPVFAYEQERKVGMETGDVITKFDDYGYREWGVKGKRCDDVTVDEHLAVLINAAKNVDSAVSKTCNVPPTTPWADFKGLYVRAWEGGCKGVTTFQTGGKRAGILKSADDDDADGQTCEIDPATGRRSCE